MYMYTLLVKLIHNACIMILHNLLTPSPRSKKEKKSTIHIMVYLLDQCFGHFNFTYGNSLGDFFPTCNICKHTIGPDKIHLNRHNLNSLSMKSDLETFNDKNFIIYIINKATGLDNRSFIFYTLDYNNR